MSRKIRFLLAIEVILSFGLLGCSSVAPDFADMSQTYQRTIEKYQNNNLLLNIVRSSKNMPLSFIDIPNVIGTGNVSETAGISGLIYSVPSAIAGGSYYMPSASLTLGRSFNFTQSSLENAQFQKEFLATIPIQTIHYFNKRHTPREFILSLVIDEILITDPNGKTKLYYNNPNTDSFPEFQTLLRKLVDDGLTTELLKVNEPVGPPMLTAKMEPMLGQVLMQFVAAKDKDKLSFKPVSDTNSKYYQMHQEKEIARFCFDPASNYKDIEREFGKTLFCQSALGASTERIENIGITGNISPNKSKKSILLVLRSNKDVYRYLGEVFNAQNQDSSKMEFLRVPTRANDSKNSFASGEFPLLVINKNPAPNVKPIASIEYDGAVYSIPAEDSGYSAMVLDILSQFLSLNKIPGSIPVSPAVIVR
jgi:hypothetical protein